MRLYQLFLAGILLTFGFQTTILFVSISNWPLALFSGFVLAVLGWLFSSQTASLLGLPTSVFNWKWIALSFAMLFFAYSSFVNVIQLGYLLLLFVILWIKK